MIVRSPFCVCVEYTQLVSFIKEYLTWKYATLYEEIEPLYIFKNIFYDVIWLSFDVASVVMGYFWAIPQKGHPNIIATLPFHCSKNVSSPVRIWDMLIIGQMKQISSHSLLLTSEWATYLWLLLLLLLILFFSLESPTVLYLLGWELSFEATGWALWAYGEDMKSLWVLQFNNTTFLHCSDADIPSTQAVMQESIFAIDEVGVWASTLVNNQLWRGCETHYWSRAEKSVTVVLYNYWWSQKMPRAKHNLLFVMLDCLSRLCQAAVFCSHVPIPCLFILCAVSFHISLVIPAWKMNASSVQEL